MILTKNQKEWMDKGEKIVSVKAPSINEFYQIQDICKENNIYSYIVTDAGRTQIDPNTETVSLLDQKRRNFKSIY